MIRNINHFLIKWLSVQGEQADFCTSEGKKHKEVREPQKSTCSPLNIMSTDVLYMITKTNWASRVTTIFDIYDVNNITTFSSCIRIT